MVAYFSKPFLFNTYFIRKVMLYWADFNMNYYVHLNEIEYGTPLHIIELKTDSIITIND